MGMSAKDKGGLISISTSIPKAHIFRFENYWLELEGFMDCVAKSWNIPSRKDHITAKIADKFKYLRKNGK